MTDNNMELWIVWPLLAIAVGSVVSQFNALLFIFGRGMVMKGDSEYIRREDVLKFIARVERRHFRTQSDSGANGNAMFLWNLLREELGLAPIKKSDLPAFCTAHQKTHIIREEYGCVISKPKVYEPLSKPKPPSDNSSPQESE